MTVYDEADAMAASFAERLASLPTCSLVGLYLVGSYALGDLHPESDVDFVAVLADPVAQGALADIKALHSWMASEHPGRPFEGFYVSADDLRHHPDASSSRGLQFLAGEVTPVAGSRLVEWEMLRRCGHRVVGTPPADLAVIDLSAELPTFSRQNLEQYWAPWLARTAPHLMRGGRRDRDGRQAAWAAAWCVLGIPRLYVAIADGAIVSKSEAGKRVRPQVDPRWWPTIDAALSYRARANPESITALAALGGDAVDLAQNLLADALALP